MVDIHTHLLPGLDDGSPEMEISVAMARMAVDDGITHLVCTPHANDRFAYDPFRVEDLLTVFRARLAEAGVELELARGADFHLTYENIQSAIADPARFSIAGKGYLMTELPEYGSFGNFDETYYQLQLAGMTPVVTHPERNATLQENPGKLLDWLNLGALIQVTSNSITGEMGKKAQRVAIDLLERRWVHFVASDAHNLTSRPPKLRAASEAVAKRCGKAYADALCQSNPMCAFLGKPLPVEALAGHQERDEDWNEGRSWWKRLLNR